MLCPRGYRTARPTDRPTGAARRTPAAGPAVPLFVRVLRYDETVLSESMDLVSLLSLSFSSSFQLVFFYGEESYSHILYWQ